MRQAETHYSRNIFNHKKHNVQQMWKHLNYILNTEKNRDNQISVDKLLINGKTITNDTEIANSLNDHFINIGYNLASTIDTGSNSFKDYLHDNISNSSSLIQQLTVRLIKNYPLSKNKKENVDKF